MIRFEHLCAGYDGAEKLHNIDLSIPEGKLTALIGPNGCGKSTLLKAASGILKPDSGTIFAAGTNICTLPARALARIIAYMPQSRPAPEMTVRQLTAHGRYPHLKWGHSLTDDDRALIRQAMESTNTFTLADKRVDRLSGGERQRAYLSMMLAQQTPVMLLDEPTTYLDLKAQFDMLTLLKQLASQGHTLLAVLHDLTLAMEYSDHIVLMNQGRIIASGAPEEIYASGLLESVFQIHVSRTESSLYHFARQPDRQ